jgi:hypothetical protein
MEEIFGRFRPGSGAARAAKSRAGTSNEVEPETRLPEVARPLYLEEARSGAGRTLTAIVNRLSIARKDQLDDSGYKRGAAVDYPETPGESYRTTALAKELNREGKDKDYHSDNEGSASTHPPWSSIDFPAFRRRFPAIPGAEMRLNYGEIKDRYTRKLTAREDQNASISTGTCICT